MSDEWNKKKKKKDKQASSIAGRVLGEERRKKKEEDIRLTERIMLRKGSERVSSGIVAVSC